MAQSLKSIAAHAPQRQLNAIVVSAGLMEKTVKAKVGMLQWNSHIRKKYARSRHVLVHDPASSLRTGDVISIQAGYRISKQVNHVVSSIIAPFGSDISERPPVPTFAELVAAKEEKRRQKDAMRGTVRDAEGKVVRRRTPAGSEGEGGEVQVGAGEVAARESRAARSAEGIARARESLKNEKAMKSARELEGAALRESMEAMKSLKV